MEGGVGNTEWNEVEDSEEEYRKFQLHFVIGQEVFRSHSWGVCVCAQVHM